MKRQLVQNINSYINIVKKWGFYLFKANVCLSFVVLIIVMLVSGCSKTTQVSLEKKETIVEEEDQYQWFPSMWINGPNHVYQPMYANRTKKDLISDTNEAVFFTSLGISYTVESADPIEVSFYIKNKKGDLLNGGPVETQLVQSDQSYLFDIKPGDIELYQIGEFYNLEIIVTMGNQEAYYYSNLMYSQSELNNISVDLVYNYLKRELKNDNISFLNIPRFWIAAQNDNNCIVRAEYTGATRLDEGFDYIDYIQELSVNLQNNSVTVVSKHSIDKQRYYYDKQALGWVLGMEKTSEEDSTKYAAYKRVIKTTDDSRYALILSDYELYILDKKKEDLQEIYRLDSFDSDYIYDEYQNHKIKILHMTEDGNVVFAVMGYIHDDTIYNQKNGISFFKYEDNKLQNIGFIEKKGSINQLELFLDHHSFYNQELDLIYFFDKQVLYKLELTTGKSTYLEAFLEAEFHKKSGVLTWQGNDTKYNGAVFIIDLNDKELKVKNLYQTGIYKRLLGVSDAFVFVGEYLLEDTYERLNGTIIYPYSRVDIYNFRGELVQSINPKDYGENMFFGGIFYDETNQSWNTDLIERQIVSREESKNSRVNFVSLNEFVNLDLLVKSSENQERNPSNLTDLTTIQLDDAYPDNIIYTLEKKQDIIFQTKPSLDEKNSSKIKFVASPQKDLYKLVDENDEELYFSTFIDALKKSKEKRDYKIYYSQFSNNEYTDILMFDASRLLTSQYLDTIKVIPQRPELPRGCEVTSLSILLNYYLEDAPDKMTLADNMKTSSVEYKVLDGFVNYANMHEAFAGSMSDVSSPGLGVYIEPIKVLAEDYLNQAPTNVSGISFEQLLTFVSTKQPVLIIIPNRYQAVADYAIEVWKTDTGYMEVTYQEHSVVVMGFDENFVYYSDPSKNIIDKKTIQFFKSAWESMGNQGLVILE